MGNAPRRRRAQVDIGDTLPKLAPDGRKAGDREQSAGCADHTPIEQESLHALFD
jgi:hypothetical protein